MRQGFSPGIDQVLRGGGEMGALMRTIDWSATPVGAPAEWPQSLKTALSICLASRFPMLIWWGPELIQFYNDAYRPLARRNSLRLLKLVNTLLDFSRIEAKRIRATFQPIDLAPSPQN